MTDHTHINLDDVEDIAPARGWDDRWEARFARQALEAEQTGVAYFRIKPERKAPFVHRHREAEEFYVIIGGSGSVKLGDEVRPVRRLDAFRVAAHVPRAFGAGPDGLEYVAFGPHVERDGEAVDDDWTAT